MSFTIFFFDYMEIMSTNSQLFSQEVLDLPSTPTISGKIHSPISILASSSPHIHFAFNDKGQIDLDLIAMILDLLSLHSI